MRHPTDGVLRRLLDEPAGVSDDDREHVTDCPQCLRDLAAVQADRDAVRSALGRSPEVDVAAAWQRLAAAAVRPEQHEPTAVRRPGRLRAVLRRPAVAGLAVAVVLTGAGTAAANDWLQVFRTEQLAPVSLRAADLVALPDLSAYGQLDLVIGPDVHEVADAGAAATETGLDVPEVTDLPRGVTGVPTVSVGSEAQVTFTFSAERAARAAADSGEDLPPVPPGLDGSSVRLVAGPGVAQAWSSSAGAPALVVGRAVAPTAFASGASFETMRDYLLGLPGLPPDVAAQLRAFAADGSTLPLPVPADQVRTSETEIGGVTGTLLQTRDRAFAAVVWVEDGVATVVAGSLDDDEVLAVARGLR